MNVTDKWVEKVKETIKKLKKKEAAGQDQITTEA